MSRLASRQTDCAQAGFTVIEVLIALAIVSICVVAIGMVVSTNSRGVRSLEQHVALVQTARSVVATAVPRRNELAPGVLSGQLQDHLWQIDVAPLSGGWSVPDGNTIWNPQLMKIHVRSPSGAVIELQTIRLARSPK